jgi:DNA-binding CsgD family transcriptional regulator/PAS domain-containing protein
MTKTAPPPVLPSRRKAPHPGGLSGGNHRDRVGRKGSAPLDAMQREVVTAIQAVYEAVASPSAWSEALTATATVAGASAGILLFGLSPGELAPLATCGLEELEPTLLAGSVAAALLRLGGGPPGALVTSNLPNTPSGRNGEDALAALGAGGRFGAAAGACLLSEEGALAALWLLRRPGERFDSANLEGLREIMPHLTRAINIHLRVEQAERRAAEARDAFDRVALGAVLVDDGARPILANRAAHRIAAQQDGFVIASDGLRGATSAETRVLQRAVADVARGGTRTGLGLRLSRASSSRPYEVMVVPVSRGKGWLTRRRHTAVVFISDSGLSFVSPAQLVHDLYGLTPAETRLTLLLLGGQTLPEAMAVLGVSRNTAHSQLASIFHKTGTNSQSELVRILLRGPGAVRLPGDSSDSYPPVEGEP